MPIIAQGVVVASRPKTDMASCCFPSVAAIDAVRWLVGLRVGPAKNSRTERVALCVSDDQGASWTPPKLPFAEVARVGGRPGQWRALNLTPLGGSRVLGTLGWEDYSSPLEPMYNETTEGLADMRMFTTVSDDAGQRWSTPLPVTFGPYESVPNAITGPTLLMPDGRWAAQFEVNKTYHDTTPWQHHSSLTFSSDQGRTWGGVADTHTDPAKRVFCWDQRLAVMRDGVVLGLYWTFDRKTAVYLNIHSAWSRDSGRTWTPVHDTGVPGQPARAVALADGRVVMVYVDRSGEPVIKARVSADGGRTWPASTELELHKRGIRSQIVQKGTMSDAWDEMSAYSVGLPDAVALPGGDVLAVFYTGPRADHTDVAWVRFGV